MSFFEPPPLTGAEVFASVPARLRKGGFPQGDSLRSARSSWIDANHPGSKLDCLLGGPTIAGAGVPGYEAVQRYGLLAPAGTPRDIITKRHAGVVRALQNPEVRQRLLNDGAEPVGSSPGEFTTYLRGETAKWAKVIRAAGIKPE